MKITDVEPDDLQGAIAAAKTHHEAGTLTTDRARTLLRQMVDEGKQSELAAELAKLDVKTPPRVDFPS